MAKNTNVPAGHTVRARDISAPRATMQFDGKDYPIRFDLNAFRIAEDVFEEQYHKDANFAEIALQLTKGRLGAIMAMYYAGLISAGADISWERFAGTFRLTDIPGVQERLTELVAEALPDADPDADKQGKPSDP